MRFGVKAVIIAMTLALSCTAGLAVASAETATTIYMPLVTATRSKIGIAPGGYVTGDLELLNAAWSYRWNNEVFSDTIDWVDMIWGARYMNVPVHSNIILGFNEPDRPDQANLDPLAAAQLWRQIETRYPDKRLISPAPVDAAWLWRMVDEYMALYGAQPRFDGIAVHYYRDSDDAPQVSAYLQQRRADAIAHGYTVPLWLTEVGACGADEVETFRDMAAFVEATDWIERAAWYKLRADYWDQRECSTMINQRGGLTPLGVEYREVVNAF